MLFGVCDISFTWSFQNSESGLPMENGICNKSLRIFTFPITMVKTCTFSNNLLQIKMSKCTHTYKST